MCGGGLAPEVHIAASITPVQLVTWWESALESGVEWVGEMTVTRILEHWGQTSCIVPQGRGAACVDSLSRCESAPLCEVLGRRDF